MWAVAAPELQRRVVAAAEGLDLPPPPPAQRRPRLSSPQSVRWSVCQRALGPGSGARLQPG
eukprot:13000085-Alexandrium_andersonii.AAC.1